MTTTREAALEAAVVKHLTWFERFICDRDELDSSTPRKVAENAKDAAVELRAALSTPATEPQGYHGVSVRSDTVTRADLAPALPSADYVAGLEAAKEFIAQDVSQWDEETLHENTSPQEAAQYIRDLNIPASRPSFVSDVMKRLRRFQEITEDVEGTGVDIGRDWLDVLTFLGLLDRVRKSPASWQLTDAGLQALTARPAPLTAADTRVREQAEVLCQIEIDRGDRNSQHQYAAGARACRDAIRAIIIGEPGK